MSGTASSAASVRKSSMIWIIVATVCIGTFMGQLDASITQLVLPALEREFSVSVGQVSWVAVIFLRAVSVMLPIFGRLADMYGRKSFMWPDFSSLSWVLHFAASRRESAC